MKAAGRRPPRPAEGRVQAANLCAATAGRGRIAGELPGRRRAANLRPGCPSDGFVPPPVLTLYIRTYCHLCDEMIAELEPLVAGRAQIQVVDISDDETLSRRFGVLIPVLMHGSEELSRYRLDTERVTELIERQS